MPSIVLCDLQAILNRVPLSSLRGALGRQRLKFTRDELAQWLWVLFEHQRRHCQFRTLYDELRPPMTYAGFTKNLRTAAALMPLVFREFNRRHGIQPSRLLTYLDTSLIPSKQTASIREQDWRAGKVTRRRKGTAVEDTCGHKLLAHLDRHGRITRAAVLPINTPDNLVTKEPLNFGLSGVVVADRGFNCKLSRQRVASCGGRLISPPHVKEKWVLTEQERRLYQGRWQIETAFQRLKDDWGHFRLAASSRYAPVVQKGDIFAALCAYNLAQL